MMWQPRQLHYYDNIIFGSIIFAVTGVLSCIINIIIYIIYQIIRYNFCDYNKEWCSPFPYCSRIFCAIYVYICFIIPFRTYYILLYRVKNTKLYNKIKYILFYNSMSASDLIREYNNVQTQTHTSIGRNKWGITYKTWVGMLGIYDICDYTEYISYNTLCPDIVKYVPLTIKSHSSECFDMKLFILQMIYHKIININEIDTENGLSFAMIIAEYMKCSYKHYFEYLVFMHYIIDYSDSLQYSFRNYNGENLINYFVNDTEYYVKTDQCYRSDYNIYETPCRTNDINIVYKLITKYSERELRQNNKYSRNVIENIIYNLNTWLWTDLYFDDLRIKLLMNISENYLLYITSIEIHKILIDIFKKIQNINSLYHIYEKNGIINVLFDILIDDLHRCAIYKPLLTEPPEILKILSLEYNVLICSVKYETEEFVRQFITFIKNNKSNEILQNVRMYIDYYCDLDMLLYKQFMSERHKYACNTLKNLIWE